MIPDRFRPLRSALCGLLLATSASGLQATTPAPEAPAAPPVRYALAAPGGAVLRNLADDNGRVVARVPEGALLRVHGERAGWLKAELSGGFPLWVHGSYVEPTGEEGVLEVTGNGVNVRVEPNSSVNNFPLSQQLYRGDRVRELPPAEDAPATDWVHFQSPPGIWAWMRSTEARPLEAGVDGAALWTAVTAGAARGKAAGTDAAGASGATAPATPPAVGDARADDVARAAERQRRANEALAAANALFEREREAELPDYEAMRAAYRAVLDHQPIEATAFAARERLAHIDVLETAADLAAELESERMLAQREREEEQRAIWEESRRKDPLGERFHRRGVLERRFRGGVTRYFLVWGGEVVCEVACSRGRYDLALFAGFELGIRGALSLPPDDVAGHAVLDAERIEVLSRR